MAGTPDAPRGAWVYRFTICSDGTRTEGWVWDPDVTPGELAARRAAWRRLWDLLLADAPDPDASATPGQGEGNGE